jgi:pyrroline-5-carboxylate reductase
MVALYLWYNESKGKLGDDEMTNIGVIGCGHIAEAMVASIVKKKNSNMIFGYDIDSIKSLHFQAEYGINVSDSIHSLMTECDIVFVNVKPDALEEVLDVLRKSYTDQIIVSPIAGKVIKVFEYYIEHVKVVRIMPNVISEIGMSVTGYTSKNMTKIEEDRAVEIIEMFGSAIKIEEEKFNAFISLSGSAPAFFYLFLKSMIEFGVDNGFTEEDARLIVAKTMEGSARLLLDKEYTEKYLIEKIATPRGNTEAGLQSFIKNGFDDVVKKALKSAMNHTK